MLIRKVLSANEFQERIPEQVRIVAVVEPPFQFIQVGIKMLDRDLMIGTDYGALQKAPGGLNAVRVNVAAYPLLDAVVDGLVAGIFVADASSFAGFQGPS
jgi:hypothetical protein